MSLNNTAASTSLFAAGSVGFIPGAHGMIPVHVLDVSGSIYDPSGDFADLVTLFDMTTVLDSDEAADVPEGKDRFFANGGGNGYRRVHGRFGGDTGNRKRSVYERFDNDIEHRIRLRNEKRAGALAIVDGIEEYRLSRAAAKPRSSTHESRADEKLPEGMVRASRTGHVVEVIRVKRRNITKTALADVVTRPTVSVDHVRGTLRLPKRPLAE